MEKVEDEICGNCGKTINRRAKANLCGLTIVCSTCYKKLRPLADGPKEFPSKIAGVSHANRDGMSRQKILSGCRVGEQLLLIRELNNPHDKHAVRVLRLDGHQVGYLTADGAAPEVARFLDLGTLDAWATITQITGGTRDQPICGANIAITIQEKPS